MDVSSGLELAFVKDIGVYSLGLSAGSITWEYDLRITDLGITISPSEEVTDAFSSVQERAWNRKTASVSFEEVRRIRIKKARINPDWHFLTVSMKYWWKRSPIGKLVLRDSHYFPVTKALESIPELKGKLRD
ncbi:MAG: hypothetical protein M1368_01020 [Thaumarchaeota archaeon]|nr:hypothetical protein [Nitrososphaerota archaeon]MDG6905057.1 hypothetical protein [Nitrososphaerota archaeon]